MINMIFKEIFSVLTWTLALFIVLELIHPGIVIAYINTNFVLLFWLINGIILLLFAKKDGHE